MFSTHVGNPLITPINEKVIGMKLSDLKNIKPVILAAGGAHKIPIIKAVLSASLIDILITDEDTARLDADRVAKMQNLNIKFQ